MKKLEEYVNEQASLHNENVIAIIEDRKITATPDYNHLLSILPSMLYNQAKDKLEKMEYIYSSD